MCKIKIATDSTADIPNSFCEELDISVLPLTILAGDNEYRDGVDITPAEFYKIIDASKQLPVSSQVASVLYSELFEETWKAGYTDLIQVTLNSKGSSTYQAAVLSKDLFYEEHPEAKEQLNIHIIDSKTYSMAYGIGVIEGAQMVQTGASVEEVIAHIEELLVHTTSPLKRFFALFVPLRNTVCTLSLKLKYASNLLFSASLQIPRMLSEPVLTAHFAAEYLSLFN